MCFSRVSDMTYFILLGICIVLNNETFANANTHPTRNGTNADRGKFTRKFTRLSDYIQSFFRIECMLLRRKVKYKNYSKHLKLGNLIFINVTDSDLKNINE